MTTRRGASDDAAAAREVADQGQRDASQGSQAGEDGSGREASGEEGLRDRLSALHRPLDVVERMVFHDVVMANGSLVPAMLNYNLKTEKEVRRIFCLGAYKLGFRGDGVKEIVRDYWHREAMQIPSQDRAVFERVMETGSLVGVAREFEMPKATVRQIVLRVAKHLKLRCPARKDDIIAAYRSRFA